MSLYAIGDLHLSLSCNKPMDVFHGWDNYVERIKENWENLVDIMDTVVIAGDISWGMNLKESESDFDFINNLPGNKIIIKGNHDYWWNTVKKMNDFFKEKEFDTIKILSNNAFLADGIAICGSRGWINEHNEPENKKLNAREAARLEMSIKEAVKFGGELIAFLHYPPVYGNEENYDILEVLYKYNITRCYYGHIHGHAQKYAVNGIRSGVDYKLVSCDYTNFSPVKIA